MVQSILKVGLPLLLGSFLPGVTAAGWTTAAAKSSALSIPPSGSEMPMGAFGNAAVTTTAGVSVTFSATASIAGGMLKGRFLNATQYAAYDAVCGGGQANQVVIFEWGYGTCTTYLKTLSSYTSFMAMYSSSTSISVTKTLNAVNAGTGLYVIFENLLGGPVTYSNAQLTVSGTSYPAPSDIVFPAATTHVSAAIVEGEAGAFVDSVEVSFTAAGTQPYTGASSTGVMVVNDDQMDKNILGCALGIYAGWFQQNVASQNICKGSDYSYKIENGILTVYGTIKAVPPAQASTLLAGDAVVGPYYSTFQGDGSYTFLSSPNGAKGVKVLIPNRLSTAITMSNLKIKYTKTGLYAGGIGGIAAASVVVCLALMLLSFFLGKRKGAAAAKNQGPMKVLGINQHGAAPVV